jgi:Uma2 family endonuclease
MMHFKRRDSKVLRLLLEVEMTSIATQGVTIEEFLAIEDPEHLLELVDGEVVTMSRPKGRHCIICSRFDRLIGNFVDEHRLGWVASNDTGIIIRKERDSLRGVDVGFWSFERQPHEPVDYFDTVPDLAVEVISPSDRRKDVLYKVRQYLDAGVRLVWLADPETETITVYRGSMTGTELPADAILDGGDVPPGFSRRVGEFF